jgi:hypothetical protein
VQHIPDAGLTGRVANITPGNSRGPNIGENDMRNGTITRLSQMDLFERAKAKFEIIEDQGEGVVIVKCPKCRRPARLAAPKDGVRKAMTFYSSGCWYGTANVAKEIRDEERVRLADAR